MKVFLSADSTGQEETQWPDIPADGSADSQRLFNESEFGGTEQNLYE